MNWLETGSNYIYRTVCNRFPAFKAHLPIISVYLERGVLTQRTCPMLVLQNAVLVLLYLAGPMDTACGCAINDHTDIWLFNYSTTYPSNILIVSSLYRLDFSLFYGIFFFETWMLILCLNILLYHGPINQIPYLEPTGYTRLECVGVANSFSHLIYLEEYSTTTNSINIFKIFGTHTVNGKSLSEWVSWSVSQWVTTTNVEAQSWAIIELVYIQLIFRGYAWLPDQLTDSLTDSLTDLPLTVWTPNI